VSDWRTDPSWPDVDVVMPIRNEAAHLADALAAIRAQSYPGKTHIFMAVGPSNDGTETIAANLAATNGDATVVDNPTGTTPAALNRAIRAGSSPVVVRVDGHSQLSDGYIERAVSTLRRTGAANVGGMQVPVPTSPFEHAVAAATTSWLGTGGASYRTGGAESAVDTVYLGVFDRASIEDVGLFDERLIRNQDYELNIRLRAAGGEVIFDPSLSVGYVPRGSWSNLISQYFQYGCWKAVVLRLHPGSLRLRQLAPPVTLSAVAASFLLVRRWPMAWLVSLGYCAAVAHSVLRERHPVRTAGATVCIHSVWSLGLIWGLFRSPLSLQASLADLDQSTGGRPSRVSFHTVAHRIGSRCTLTDQPERHPET
jgi:succinoglycan biosynthesis protein ExoA